MKVRKIIISDHDKKSGTLGIKIDKEKLVKYIVDPEIPLIETNEDTRDKIWHNHFYFKIMNLIHPLHHKMYYLFAMVNR